MIEMFTAYRRDSGAAVQFPVDWPTPEQAERVWSWDPQHNPFPLTPLSASFSQRGPQGPVGSGGGGNIVAHGYRYAASRGGAMSGSRRRAEAGDALAEEALRLNELWDNGWRLEIEREARAIAAAEYDSLTLSELWPHLAALPATMAKHSDLMFRALDLITYWRGALTEFCLEHFSELDVEATINQLLEGEASPSTESAVELWEIVQSLKDLPETRELIGSATGGFALERLAALEGGSEPAAALASWLDRYGRRNGSFGELAEPNLREEPRLVQALLRGYLDSPNPRLNQERLLARRAEFEARLVARLSKSEPDEFLELVQRARRYVPVKEDRNFITAFSRGCMREPILSAGQKLAAAGAIDQRDDVFYLTLAELEAACVAPDDQRAVVAERKAAYDHWRNVVPPGSIGGNSRASEPGATESSLKGVGVSAGLVRGIARVIMTLDESDRLQPGEILVTRTTTSTWTPLFHTAAAVVVDGGSMLSHAAVVAREFQLSAVVGVNAGTRLIPDGAMITVDGTSGLVVIDRQ